MPNNRSGQTKRRYHENVANNSSPPRWLVTSPWAPTGSGACPSVFISSPHTLYSCSEGSTHQQFLTTFHPQHRQSENFTSSAGQLPPEDQYPHQYSSSNNPLSSRPAGPPVQSRRSLQHILSKTSQLAPQSEATNGGEHLYSLHNQHNPAAFGIVSDLSCSPPPHHSLMAEAIGCAGTGKSGGGSSASISGQQDLPPFSEVEKESDGGTTLHETKDAPNVGRGKQERLCGVCGDRALGYNFNAITCESCKAFFRRNALKNKNLKCPFQDNCTVDTVTRRFCQKCRLNKCFVIGMKKEWIMTEDEKRKKKQKIEANKIRKFVGGTDLHGRSHSVDSSEDSISFTLSPGIRKGDLALSPVGSPRATSRHGDPEFTSVAEPQGKAQPFLPPCSPGVSVALGLSDQALQKLKDQQMLKEEYMKTTPVPSLLPLQESVGKHFLHENNSGCNNGLKPQAIVRGMVREANASAPKVQRLLNQTDVHDPGHTNLNLTTSSSHPPNSAQNMVSSVLPQNSLHSVTSFTPSVEHDEGHTSFGQSVASDLENRSSVPDIRKSPLTQTVTSVAPHSIGQLSTTLAQGNLHYNQNADVSMNCSLLDHLVEPEASFSNVAEELILPQLSSNVDNVPLVSGHSNISLSNSLSSNESTTDIHLTSPTTDSSTSMAVVTSNNTSTVISSPSNTSAACSTSSNTSATCSTSSNTSATCSASSNTSAACSTSSNTSAACSASSNTSAAYSTSSNTSAAVPSSSRTSVVVSSLSIPSAVVSSLSSISTAVPTRSSTSAAVPTPISNATGSEVVFKKREMHDDGEQLPGDPVQHISQDWLRTHSQWAPDSRSHTGDGSSSEDILAKHVLPTLLETLSQSEAEQHASFNDATLVTRDSSAAENFAPTEETFVKHEPYEAVSDSTGHAMLCSATLDSAGDDSEDSWSDFRVLDALQTIQGGQGGDSDQNCVVDSIVNSAVQAEYSPTSLLVRTTQDQEHSSNRRRCGPPLTQMERHKLQELHAANAAMMAPLSEDQAYKNQHNPSLINVINMTDIAIRRLIQMSKQLESFSCLCTEDQIALLKGSCTEMMILRSVAAYDADKDSWKIPEHHDTYKSIKLKVLKAAPGNVHVYEEHKRFILAFRPEWRHDQNIMLLLSAITLFTSSRPNVRHPKAIQHEQCCYLFLLKRYLESTLGGCECRTVYAGLLERINDLRRLNENHIKVYMQVNPEEVRPLLIEIFDLQQR